MSTWGLSKENINSAREAGHGWTPGTGIENPAWCNTCNCFIENCSFFILKEIKETQRAVPLINDNRLIAGIPRRAVPKFEEKYPEESKVKKEDLVNHPYHYTSGGIETIDFIEAKQLNYNLGNGVKYITRAGKKSGPSETINESRIQDLEKAVWYLQREIQNLKKGISQ